MVHNLVDGFFPSATSAERARERSANTRTGMEDRKGWWWREVYEHLRGHDEADEANGNCFFIVAREKKKRGRIRKERASSTLINILKLLCEAHDCALIWSLSSFEKGQKGEAQDSTLR